VVIQLYKGATYSEQVKRWSNLLTFLKGSNKAKLTLKQEEPEQFAYFQKIWDIRSRHMIVNLYAYQSHCSNPECMKGEPSSTHR